jgi:hypothetical protein
LKLLNKNSKIWSICILTGIIILIFLPISLVQIYIHDNNDYRGHIYYAKELEIGFNQIIPTNQSHPLYQIIILTIHLLSNVDFNTSAVILALMIEVILGLEIYWMLSNLRITNYKFRFLVIPLTLCTLVAAPIPLLVFIDRHLYYGYLGIANYHNPTINLLKPFALLLFLISIKAFQNPKPKFSVTILAAILVILSTLDKPNLIVCLLPALAIMAGVNIMGKKPVDWILLILGFFLPACLILIWEYNLAFSPESEGILIEPFTAMRLLSDHVITKFFISIIFPLGVGIAYFKELIKDKQMILAWLFFFFGVFYTYFLIEGGSRRADGNFGWSGEISMFLLFIFSSVFFLKVKNKTPKVYKTDIILSGIFFLYIASGIIYYIFSINVNHVSYLPEGVINLHHFFIFDLKPGLF